MTTADWLDLCGFLDLLHKTQDQPRNGTAHNGLGAPMPIISQENALSTSKSQNRKSLLCYLFVYMKDNGSCLCKFRLFKMRSLS